MRIFNAWSLSLLHYYTVVSYLLFLLVESVLQQLSVFTAPQDNGEMMLSCMLFFILFASCVSLYTTMFHEILLCFIIYCCVSLYTAAYGAVCCFAFSLLYTVTRAKHLTWLHPVLMF